MEIKTIAHEFSICKVADLSGVDLEAEFCFLEKTDQERSLVCMTEHVPMNTIEREDGWKAFRIQGVLDFSLVGVLSRISTLLADNQIAIFAISTFNTDYFLTKTENFSKAITLLEQAGYQIR